MDSTIFSRNYLKVGRLIILALILGMFSGQTAPSISAQDDGNRSLLFIENMGQFPDASTHFQANLGRITLRLADDALWLTMIENPPIGAQTTGMGAQPQPGQGVNLKVSFTNSNPAPQLEPFNRLEVGVSYFVGRDSAAWQTNVPVWGGVRYVNLYPGLDLEITSQNGQLSLRLVVKDEAAVAQATAAGESQLESEQQPQDGIASPLADLRLQIEGAEDVGVDGTGGLRLTTALGDVTLPLLQVVTAGGVPMDLPVKTPEVQGFAVSSPFSSASVNEAAFSHASAEGTFAAAGGLDYSTFIGGSYYFDSSQDIAIDEAGHAYITGRAYTTFPSTPGVFDPTIEGFFNDAFIAKLTPDGSGLVYATFLGGSAFEWTYAIAVDETGNAYVTGFTGSTDFPTTPGAFDDSLSGESDAFVAKINPDATALLYATLVGGNDTDYGQGLALDDSGQAYLTGLTLSTDFPTTPGALAAAYNGGFSDGFAVKVAADGSDLVYSTYVGGSADESSYDIAVDDSGQAYLTGYTGSTDFPTTPGALDITMTGSDAFVVKLNSDGSDLVYGTFLGGSFADGGRAIALDSAGSAYITGRTDSRDFPATPDAFDTSYSSANDIFVAKLAPDGNGLFYATYLGGNNEEEGRDLVVDAAGSVYVTGQTAATDFPTTPDAFAPTCQGCSQEFDAFVAKINPNGTGLIYATYLGGSGHDEAFGLAQDENGYVYVTGETWSSNFPTTSGAFDTALNGFGNGFVSKLFVGTELGPPPSPLPAHSCGPTFLDTFTVQNEPRGLAIDSDRQRLYVANFGSDSVSVVDSNNDNVILTIPGLDSANGLAYDPTQNLIWVTNYNADQVTPIQADDDATSFTVLPSLSVGDGPWGVAYDPVHNYVYVANSLDSSVSVIDAGAQSLVTTLHGAFHQPFHLVANPVTGKVYVANSGHNSVTVINGTAVNKEVQLWDSGRAYGIAVDETRDLIYVATVEKNRIVAIGPIQGQPDQFLGWASFQQGYNPNRRIPLRVIAVNPQLGPVFDGGHLWATTSTGDGSEANQALFIPKGWNSRFHVPFAQSVGANPNEGIAIDHITNRVYVSGGDSLGLVTVLGDHDAICGGIAPAAVSPKTDQITFDVYSVEEPTLPGSPPIVLAINGPASVEPGETFRVTVEAQGVTDPGLYGAQLEINFDPNLAKAANLQVNSDLNFILSSTIDNDAGKIKMVASRQGEVSGLVGEVPLLTFDITAAEVSGTAVFTFGNEKIGDPKAQAFDTTSQTYTVSIGESATPIPVQDTPTPTNTPTTADTPTPTAPTTPSDTPTPTALPILLTDTPAPTNTPTSTPDISTSTPEPTTATISGQMILAGRVDNIWSGAVITIDDREQSTTTDTAGNFNIANVATGIHTSITANAPGYLSASCTAPTITAPETVLNSITLLSGDVNGDDMVDITDATAIGLSFGEIGLDLPPNTDINRDEVIDILDIILVSVNFGKAGPQLWLCQ